MDRTKRGKQGGGGGEGLAPGTACRRYTQPEENG